MRFLIRCLRTTRDVPSKAEQKLIADNSARLLTDTSAPMRDCAAETMGTLMKIIGERAMNPHMDGLDEIRKTKIKEFFEAAQVKAKEKPKPVAPPPAAKAPPRKLGTKPSLKKKAPAPAAAPPVEEYAPPPAAKPAARALAAPGSKMAPKGGLGGSRLVKKGPPSPKRALPCEYEEEEPAPAAPPNRLGVGRGLAGRPLSKEPAVAAAPTRVDPQIAIDKAELEELRAERERWEKEKKEHQLERSKLMQEINDLQLQVCSQLVHKAMRANRNLHIRTLS